MNLQNTNQEMNQHMLNFVHEDQRFSNLINLLHTSPIYDRRKMNYSWRSESQSSIHSYVTRQNNVQFKIDVTGATVLRFNKNTGREEECVFWPGDREERVVDAIIKIASEGGIANINAKNYTGYGCYFSIYMIKEKIGNSSSEIKEAIEILNKSTLEITYFDEEKGKTENVSATFLPIKYLSNNQGGKRDDRCYVIFHPVMMEAIDAIQYRPYLYDYSETYKRSLSRYLHKRLVSRYVYAANEENNSHSMRLRNIMNDFGKIPEDEDIPYSRLRNLARDLRNALGDLVKNNVITANFKMDKIRDNSKGPNGPIVDYKVHLHSTEKFAKHQKRVNYMVGNMMDTENEEREEKVIP